MEKFSIVEVIEQAIQTERAGYKFYSSLVEKFEEPALKDLFLKLAARERQHEKTYTELKDMVKQDEEPAGWDEASAYLKAIIESHFFVGKGKSMPLMDYITTKKQAIEIALCFEKETLLYFYGLREVVKEKEVVDEIINEEKSHIMWLERFG